MVAANCEAGLRGDDFVGEAHLVVGLLSPNAELTSTLERVGVDPARLRSQLDTHHSTAPGRIRSARDVVEIAIREASDRQHIVIGVEYIALALLSESSPVLVSALNTSGLESAVLRAALVERLQRHPAVILPDPDTIKQLPEVQPLLAELNRQQQLKEEVIEDHDFETAAKHRDETDRIKREIEDMITRLSGNS